MRLIVQLRLPGDEIVPNPRTEYTMAVTIRSTPERGEPTLFDRVMRPGYRFMDRGVLRGLRQRVETPIAPAAREAPATL